MTLVITILADDNARNRRRKRRAEQRAQNEADNRLARKIAVASAGCSLSVARATSLPAMRKKDEGGAIERKNHRTWYSKLGERGITCSGRQKMKGKSIPLI